MKYIYLFIKIIIFKLGKEAHRGGKKTRIYTCKNI